MRMQRVTVVAALALASCIATAQPLRAFGLPHEALGQAELRPTGEGLVVSNIGSSGQDGVRVGLGEAEFHVVTFEPPPLTSLPDGAFLETTVRGVVDGEPDQFVWSIRSTARGGDSFLSFDATRVRPAELRLEARLGGQTVSEVRTTRIDPRLELVVIRRLEGCIIDPFWPMPPECWAIVAFPRPTELELLGGGVVTADEVIIATVGQQAVVGTLSATEMRGADYREITLTDEALGQFDFEHRALGQAQMSARGGQLTVSNIGSSGQDGVRVSWFEETGAREGFDVEMVALSLRGPDQGLTLRATGRVPGAPELSLGSSSIDNGIVTAEFRDLGAQTATLIGLLDGRIVDRRDVPAGGRVIVMDEIVVHGCAKQPSLPIPPFPPFPCFIWRFEETLISPIVGPPYVADEVRILASDATVRFDGLESFSISGRGIDRFSILGETLIVDCRADLDGDGRLTIFDFLEFQSLFASGDLAADFDGDGRLTIFDFLAFQTAFVIGCS